MNWYRVRVDTIILSNRISQWFPVDSTSFMWKQGKGFREPKSIASELYESINCCCSVISIAAATSGKSLIFFAVNPSNGIALDHLSGLEDIPAVLYGWLGDITALPGYAICLIFLIFLVISTGSSPICCSMY